MPTILAKIQGYNAAAVVSNSMGDVTEGKSYRAIEEQFGFVDTPLPQDKGTCVQECDWGPPWDGSLHGISSLPCRHGTGAMPGAA